MNPYRTHETRCPWNPVRLKLTRLHTTLTTGGRALTAR